MVRLYDWLLGMCNCIQLFRKKPFSDSNRVVARWSEHFQKLLDVPGDIDHEALDNMPQRIAKTSLDEIPTMAEIARAIAGLKDGNAPGEMEFPQKYGSTEETICSADCSNYSPMPGKWALYHKHGRMPAL